ncbi:MAG: hypothetical protein ABIW32_09625 [Terrimesophilobacter sp.]
MGGQLLSAAWTVVMTVAVIFALLVGGGFWLLSRRKKVRHTPDALGALEQRANILLVRVDDAIKAAEDELAFAIAQFGDVKSQEFELVLSSAKSQLKEAFGLQQKLDDAYTDSETQRRDWNGRIIHLCETARDSLQTQEVAFATLRELEKNAPQNLSAVRTAIDGVDARMAAATATLDALTARYNARALSTISDNIDHAAKERADAAQGAERASKALGETGSAAKVGTATELIQSAAEHIYRAGKFLDAIDTLHDELITTSDALAALRESTTTSLAGARSVRDTPPNPDAGVAVNRAIGIVEAALATDREAKDPFATLETLREANAELDASMAVARNQTQRLEGARTALVGALVGARSQLKATKNFIDNRRGGVGAEARTRLAEAERLLMVAEAETDPVAALDTARSSATYARDADALARFDLTRQ